MTVVRGQWCTGGVWDRVGIREGVPGGLYRGTTHPPREEALVQRSGPRRPCRGRSGWYQGWTRDRRLDGLLHPPLRGPVAPWAPWCRTPRIAASWPIKARFHVISYKVSQNRQVSPKSVQKAYHSPCFQNEAKKSPLDFLRFPVFPAFSHKELMGRFDPHP